MMEKAGADALEINILSLQTDKDYTPGSFEQRHIDILCHIKKVVKIPVIMKLGSNLTNPVALINQLYANGAAAVVLFNRFYQTDINIDTMAFTSANVMSTLMNCPTVCAGQLLLQQLFHVWITLFRVAYIAAKELLNLFWLAQLLFEVCSVIYQYGAKEIENMKKELSEWMDEKGYESLSQFKGKMNAESAGEINPFERTQFMRYYSNREE